MEDFTLVNSSLIANPRLAQLNGPKTSDEFPLRKRSIPNDKPTSIFANNAGSILKVFINLLLDRGLQHLLGTVSQNLTQHITNFIGRRALRSNVRIVDAADCFYGGFLVTVLHGWRSFRGELVFVS